METFKKELNELLAKYPDLPEMTITIRPRVSFDEKKPPYTVLGSVPMPMMPAAQLNTIPDPGFIPGAPKITNARIEEMKKMTETT